MIQGSVNLLEEYADFKRAYKDTETKCQQQGIHFAPLIIEAHGGGWGSMLRQTVSFFACQQRAAGEWCREGTSARMAQRISTTLQRANARAILRRLSAPATAAEVGMDLEQAFAD